MIGTYRPYLKGTCQFPLAAHAVFTALLLNSLWNILAKINCFKFSWVSHLIWISWCCWVLPSPLLHLLHCQCIFQLWKLSAVWVFICQLLLTSTAIPSNAEDSEINVQLIFRSRLLASDRVKVVYICDTPLEWVHKSTAVPCEIMLFYCNVFFYKTIFI